MSNLPSIFDPAAPELDKLRALVAARVGDPSAFVADWYESWLDSHTPETRARYFKDNQTFATWLGAETPGQALMALLASGQGQTNQALTKYRTFLVNERHYKPRVVNRHLSAVRSALKTARVFGLANWSPEVKGVAVKRVAEMPGELTLDSVTKLFGAVRGDRTTQVRDRAILWLLWGLGLRRFEVTGLDLEDYDRANNKLFILGKGEAERTGMTLPREAADALRAWIKLRGRRKGPLITNQDRGHKLHAIVTVEVDADGKPRVGEDREAITVTTYTNRLTDRSLHAMVAHYGKKAGLYARPHLIRRAAINYVLDLTDLRTAQAFARHELASTTSGYLSIRHEEATKAAQAIASALEARLEEPEPA